MSQKDRYSQHKLFHSLVLSFFRPLFLSFSLPLYLSVASTPIAKSTFLHCSRYDQVDCVPSDMCSQTLKSIDTRSSQKYRLPILFWRTLLDSGIDIRYFYLNDRAKGIRVSVLLSVHHMCDIASRRWMGAIEGP